MTTEDKIANVATLAEHFMAGRYDEAIPGLRALRPDLSDESLMLELAMAATKVLSEHYTAIRAAAEEAIAKIDAALLADPAPLSDYALARDVLRSALWRGMITEAEQCRCGQPAGPQHCDHCHDDPPLGHVCPRCKRPASDLAEGATQ